MAGPVLFAAWLLTSWLRLSASVCFFPLPRALKLHAVRYLDAMRDRSNQPLPSPLPDILAMLERSAGGSGTAAAAPAQQPAGRPERRCPCTIIYCGRREDTDNVCSALLRRGFRAAAYHAGLPDAVRSRVLEDWRARRLDVVAATVAFGMGVDRPGGLAGGTVWGDTAGRARLQEADVLTNLLCARPSPLDSDVRTVIHYSLPQTLEAYYQEAVRSSKGLLG